MLADAFTWICDSPRRLLVVGLSLVIVVFVVGGQLVGNDKSSATTGPGTVAVTTSTAAAVPESGPYVSAAVNFTKLWAQLAPGETAAQWQARLDPLATADFGRALRTTDTTGLPGVAPAGEPVVRFLAQASAMVAVPLADGSSVLVTVVAGDGTSQPLVSDVQPDTGD